MNPHLTQRIFLATIASAVLLTLLAYAVWGSDAAIGAAVAGGVAAANWGAIFWMSDRVAKGRFSKNGFMIAVAMKSGVLMALCWLSITRFGLDFNGFTLGIGALVLGVLVGNVMAPPLRMAEES